MRLLKFIFTTIFYFIFSLSLFAEINFLNNFQENLFYIKSILEKVAVKNKKILNWFIKFLTS